MRPSTSVLILEIVALAIDGDRIAAVGDLAGVPGRREIDVTPGRFVEGPGFKGAS